MALTLKQILLMVGMLATGTLNTISKKIQLDCLADGIPSNRTTTSHKFNKPWFQTFIMFLGELTCLFGFLILRFHLKRKFNSPYRPIGEESASPPSFMTASLFSWVFILPSMCDMVGTSLQGIGLVFIDASIWQMMRGCLIIFTGILSMIFLKRRLFCFHWSGMMLNVVGLALVGVSSVLKQSGQGAGGSAVFGVLLVLAGCLATAAQMIIEELFLKKRGFHPLQVVGMEGAIGALVMAVVVLPAMQYIPGSDVNNAFENTLDSLYMLTQNALLLVNVIVYVLSIAFYNYFGLSITRSLSAVHRTLIDALRTICVWVVDLIIYYAIDKRFGEPFDTTYGLLQLDGFAFLLMGTAIYNQVADVSWIRGCVPPPETTPLLPEAEAEAEEPLIAPAPSRGLSIQADGVPEVASTGRSNQNPTV